MKTIHKYQIEITDRQTITSHEGATFVRVGVQDGVLTLWAMVDTEAMEMPHEVVIVGTGNARPHEDYYVGSAIMEPFVWHVFVR